MAYGNWGSFVYLNGKRMKRKEDAPAFDAEESKLPSSISRTFYHAVLGAGNVRLCAYKNCPLIFTSSDDGEVREIDVDRFQIPDERASWDDHEYEGTINGHELKITQYNNNMIDLWMKTPSGDIWTSTAGYEYGAGFMDDVS